jgi:hypothetical protein
MFGQRVCTGSYDLITHKIPVNADPDCGTSNVVVMNSMTIQIPPGTYAWAVTNPNPPGPGNFDNTIWVAGINGRSQSYEFEAGKHYTFAVDLESVSGNDRVTITIADAKSGEILAVEQRTADGILMDVRTASNPDFVSVPFTAQTTAPAATPSAPVNYSVYRLVEGAEESTWALLSETVSGLTFTDNAWGTLTEGMYQYAIKANYQGGVQSVARLTNVIERVLDVFTVTITAPTNGTIVVKDNEDNVITSGGEVLDGTAITITATPDQGFVLSTLTVNGAAFTSGNSHVVTENITVVATFTDDVSTRDLTSDMFTIFPNPVQDELRIQTEQTIKQIEMTDLRGRVVRTWMGNHKMINVQGISAGNYILRIHTEHAIVPIKIVKQ